MCIVWSVGWEGWGIGSCNWWVHVGRVGGTSNVASVISAICTSNDECICSGLADIIASNVKCC